MVIINLIAITQFFQIIYIAIIDYLIVSSRQEGFLESISYHYSILETNDCSMLYLYYMI